MNFEFDTKVWTIPSRMVREKKIKKLTLNLIFVSERMVRSVDLQNPPLIGRMKCPAHVMEKGKPSVVGHRVVKSHNLSCHAIGLMNKYQYDIQSKTLEELYGVEVKDFGRRRLEHGTSGHDVLVLQNFLLEEGYLARDTDDGAHGYFGDATKSALEAWQRDVGISPTGVLDDVSRAAYLQYVQDTLKLVGIVENNNAVAYDGRVQVPHVAAGTAVAGVLMMMMMRVWVRVKRSSRDNDATSMPVNQDQSPIKEVQPASSSGRGKRAGPKKLSKEELERYIAPMRGSSKSAKNVNKKEKADTKLGRYFGGRQVLEDIRKQTYGYQKNTRVNPSSKGLSGTMEHVGYDINKTKGLKKEENDTILHGTELDTRPKAQPVGPFGKENEMNDSEHMVLNDTTVVLQNRPVKLHKPLKTTS